MKVAAGAEQEEHTLMNSDLELVFTRCIEMVAESIPGAVLTTYATLTIMQSGGGWTYRAIGSIVVSALTTGFGAATISFE
jgi:hypothetical protein